MSHPQNSLPLGVKFPGVLGHSAGGRQNSQLYSFGEGIFAPLGIKFSLVLGFPRTGFSCPASPDLTP